MGAHLLLAQSIEHRDEDAVSGDDEQPDPGEDALETDPIYRTPAGSDDGDALGNETVPSDEPHRLADESSGGNSEVSDHVVKICKTCMISQRDGGNFCKKCGEELVPIRSVQNTCIGDGVGDKYTIVDELGSGGMGDVYLGLNEPIGQQVAIKFLNEKFTSDEDIVLRFLNEARSYCKVNHPNAVTLLEYGQHDDGALYLITEFVDGQSLREVVREVGPLDTRTIVSVGMQVCEVLTAAHGQDVIHRDLKPDNLMLVSGPSGRYAVKVLDFGIAKIADEDIDGPMTETGSVFGTPEFMSPEQARGRTADPRSDIYSLGIILYYMATGELPFTGKSKFSVLDHHINDAPTPPSEVGDGNAVHPELEAIILRCLQKDPDERFSTGDDVASALEAIDWNSGDVSTEKLASKEANEDGPAADGESVQPLGLSTFDDVDADGVDLSFEDDEAVGKLDDEGEFDTDRGDDPQWPDGPAVDAPNRSRLVILGVAATVVVVGLVVVFTGSDEPSDPGLPPVATAVDTAATAQRTAALETAGRLVDDGEFDSADGLLGSMDVEAMNPGQRGDFENLVDRASRARNAEMQLRSAVEARDCDRARSLLERLTEASPGAADDRGELVAECDEDGEAPHAELGDPGDHGGAGGPAGAVGVPEAVDPGDDIDESEASSDDGAGGHAPADAPAEPTGDPPPESEPEPSPQQGNEIDTGEDDPEEDEALDEPADRDGETELAESDRDSEEASEPDGEESDAEQHPGSDSEEGDSGESSETDEEDAPAEEDGDDEGDDGGDDEDADDDVVLPPSEI